MTTMDDGESEEVSTRMIESGSRCNARALLLVNIKRDILSKIEAYRKENSLHLLK
jgi:hypothetical protein